VGEVVCSWIGELAGLRVPSLNPELHIKELQYLDQLQTVTKSSHHFRCLTSPRCSSAPPTRGGRFGITLAVSTQDNKEGCHCRNTVDDR